MYDKAELTDGANGSAQFLNENPEFAKGLLNLIQDCSTADKRFELLVDLGIVTVPDDYVHEKQLKMFKGKNGEKFYYYNDDITDKHFSNPTRILKPGDKLWLRTFKQIAPGSTTSEDRMKFLASKKAIHVGAQGASLVFDQKRNQLPKGYWYCSFDEKDRLWKDADGRRRVPVVDADTDGDFRFDLGDFERAWAGHSVLLCFCDL
ncbi:MAG: hypothetical protein WC769_12635 [Thermodesulfovibrionales bacterium]